MLPFEDEIATSISIRFANELTFARRLIEFGVSWTRGESIHVGNGRGLSRRTMHAVLAIYAKTSQQFRSVMALAEIGLTHDAATINRTMFESILLLQFLLRPRIKIREGGKALPPALAKRINSTAKRVRIYSIHLLFERLRFINQMAATPGAKRAAKSLGPTGDLRKAASRAEKMIGVDWVAKLKRRKTYCGVTIRELAESYRLTAQYVTLYTMMSSKVHSADATDYLDLLDERDGTTICLSPDPSLVGVQLDLGARFYLGALSTIDWRLRLGHAEELKRFMAELDELAKTPKNISHD